MNVNPDILLVIASIVTILSISSVIAGWASRVFPWFGLIFLAIGVGLIGYVHLSAPEGLEWWSIPNAFVNVAAMILN